MNDISDIFKIIRKKTGLTQNDFANRIGLKQNTLSMIESGKNSPTIDTLYAIIKEFGVDANIFFDEFGHQLISNAIGVFPVTRVSEESTQLNSKKTLQVTEKELDDLIKYKLHYMEYYLLAISYHVRIIQESQLGIKINENHHAVEEAYLKQYTGNILQNEQPAYNNFSMSKKMDLIRELDEATRQYLDNIWKITIKLI